MCEFPHEAAFLTVPAVLGLQMDPAAVRTEVQARAQQAAKEECMCQTSMLDTPVHLSGVLCSEMPSPALLML